MSIDRDRATVSEILDVLARVEGGATAARDLLPLVHGELRRLAARELGRAAPGETVQPTSLVHEGYLRLMSGGSERSWQNRGHFYATAAEAMRRILIDRARDEGRLKRGGGRRRHFLDLDELFDEGTPPDGLIDRDEALRVCPGRGAAIVRWVKPTDAKPWHTVGFTHPTGLPSGLSGQPLSRLAEVVPDSAALVKLRVFAGLTLGQAARARGSPAGPRTATGPSHGPGCSSNSAPTRNGTETEPPSGVPLRDSRYDRRTPRRIEHHGSVAGDSRRSIDCDEPRRIAHIPTQHFRSAEENRHERPAAGSTPFEGVPPRRQATGTTRSIELIRLLIYTSVSPSAEDRRRLCSEGHAPRDRSRTTHRQHGAGDR